VPFKKGNKYMLTSRQNAVLVYLDQYRLKQSGRPLSFMDMKDAVKASSMRSVHLAIAALEKQGFIARRRGRVCDFEVLRLPDDGPGMPVAIDSIASAIPRSDVLPSLQALQIATAAVRRGYGLTDAARDPEIAAHAVEFSFLLTALGLVPTEPGVATAQRDAVTESRHEWRAEGSIDRLSGTGSHVLVVDDVSDVLVSVTAFLVTAGFMVTTAADGDAALRLIATDPLIGVLVTDFAMPGLSGVDLITQATQLRPELKCLLITGYPGADGLADLPPGVEVLAKPFRRAALIERVSVLTGETRSARAEPELTNRELTNRELTNPELTNPELTNPELTNPELTNEEFARVTN
jgi:CheY-like chemotaxis protein